MGCKQSKYAGGAAMLDTDDYENDDIVAFDTEIRATHQYMDGAFPNTQSSSMAVQASEQQLGMPNHAMCSDAHFAKIAEGCSSGFLEMFSFGNDDKRLITNGPAMENAYQQPAYNYQQPESDRSVGANSATRSQRSANSQNSGRRGKLVQSESFTL